MGRLRHYSAASPSSQRRRRGRAVLLELDDECDAKAEALLRVAREGGFFSYAAGVAAVRPLGVLCAELVVVHAAFYKRTR